MIHDCSIDLIRTDISEVDENQLVLYAQMANLVDLILPSVELDLKEIAHTFSKVNPTIMFHNHDHKFLSLQDSIEPLENTDTQIGLGSTHHLDCVPQMCSLPAMLIQYVILSLDLLGLDCTLLYL